MSAIAIVGMGCRFAGAHDLHAYWTLTLEGRDAFGPVPPDRWAHEAFFDTSRRAADKTYAPSGGFLSDIRSFPALFLGIPPRRVEVMDPQQRLCIEIGLQAIQDAGYRPSELPDRTGVYMGVTANEFRVMIASRVIAAMMATGHMGTPPDDPAELARAVERVVPPRPFSAPGVLVNMNAAAVAQELDLKGPAYTLDAACASALVALHDAVAQLRAGSVDAAVAGGVYLQLTPENYLAFSRIGAMSAQGRCIPFDANADGFVQGEGAGAVVLKRLDDAIADDDRIYAVIEGVALNNDGRGDGPMAPVSGGQASVMTDAWRDAGLEPGALQYLETHGTGTDVGDVSEVRAMREALGTTSRRLWLGSSKANVGHTMSAAAMAGVIRTALAIDRRVIPPMAGFTEEKASLDLASSNYAVPTEVIPWDCDERLAGLSSFGFGGTNGHLVMRAPPEARSMAPIAMEQSQLELVRFSAGTGEGLRRTAQRIADTMREDASVSVPSVAHTWGARPSVGHRAAIVADGRDDLIAQLDLVAAGEFPKGGAVGEVRGPPAKVALLFPGQGAQRTGMLSSVNQRFPVVKRALDQFEADLHDVLDTPLTHLLYPARRRHPLSDEEAEQALTATEHCQPALVAVGLALHALLDQVGIRPVVACGHSLGEFAAGAVGGITSRRDAVRYAALRGQAMAAVQGDPGTMAALRCSADRAQELLVEGAVIANDNHPAQVVISGTTPAVEQVMANADAAGVDAKALNVSHAFHSPIFSAVDGEALVAAVELHEPSTGVTVASGIASSPYRSRDDAVDVYRRHATSPVHFQGALRQCADEGATVYLQVGAGGPLASFARKVVGDDAAAVISLSGMDDDDDGRAVLEALARLWCVGVDLDTRPITTPALIACLPAQELPRESYWPIKDQPQRSLALAGVAQVAAPEAHTVVTEAPADDAPAGDDVYSKVADVVAKVSSYPRAAIRAELSLVDDLGFDSLMVSDLATGLADAFPGLGGLPQELLLNRPTVQAIVDHVASGDTGAQHINDDEPLRSYRPVWRDAPPPDPTPSANALEGWTVLLTGARDEEITAALKGAGARITRKRDAEVDLIVHASFADPVPPAAVISGETECPDPAAALIEALDVQARAKRSPHLVVACRTDDPWAEGLAAVVRSVAREWSATLAKTVAFEDLDGSFRAARLVQEIVSTDRSTDVRWSGAGRAIRGLQVEDAASSSESVLGPGARVLVTGGTRGIGRSLAEHLAAAGADVVVVGRSATTDALPERVQAIVADVSDREALVAAAAPHRPFTAVVHCAGLLADGPLGEVSPEAGARARHVKVLGYLHALAAAGSEVRVAMGVGSWAGRFGNRHQAHYAAGNATLAALAEHLDTEERRTVVGEFGPWSSSDMVSTIPAVVQAAMRAEGVDFVGDEPGLATLLDDLARGRGARVKGRDLPWWTRRRTLTHHLATDSHPYLLDHAIKGVPVLPLAGACDLLAQVAALPHPFEIVDLELFQGIAVSDPVTLVASIDGERAELRIGDRGTLAYKARIRPASDVLDAAALVGGDPPTTPLDAFYRDVTFHGPRLQGLTRVDGIGSDFARGQVRSGRPSEWIPETRRATWSVDPLALDSAFQLGALVVWDRYHRVGTPVAIRRLVQLSTPTPGPLTAEARFDEAEGDMFIASFWLRDAAGDLVTLVEGTVAEMRRPDDAAVDLEIKPEWVDPGAWQELKDLDQRIEMALAIGLENPYFHVHEGTARDTTTVAGRELINFSSYNYLGLSGDPRVVEQVKEAVARYGTSVSASRVASGERPFHQELEAELAAAQGLDDALVFTAGHMTNVNVVGHLMKPPDLVLHDELIHDSVLQGIKLSGAGRRSYRHEDPDHLEQLLRELRANHEKCLIIVEGVYSMDGDITMLPEWVRLKQKYGALLMVDEAHSFGVCGPTGRGVGEHWGNSIDPRQADLWMGTLSKSLASCGGWIGGSSDMIRYLRYTAPGFVYSAGITAANGVAALASLRLMLEEPWRVQKLQENAKTFHDALVERGVDTGPARGGSGVIPAVTGNSMHALVLSQRLKEQGINVQPIVYPAVADDAARLRFFLSSTHSAEQLVHTAERVATNLEQIRKDFPV